MYVRAFPEPLASGQLKISEGGGTRPRWGPDGRTVYYLALDGGAIHAVRVNPGPPFRVVSRERVLAAPVLGPVWPVDRRTGRMVVAQDVVSSTVRMVVVVNWLDQLRRRSAVEH